MTREEKFNALTESATKTIQEIHRMTAEFGNTSYVEEILAKRILRTAEEALNALFSLYQTF